MTDIPDPTLKARARAAFERAGGDTSPIEMPPDPEKLARLERAVTLLPRMTRDVFLAHRLDGYTYAQIADITGLSVRQVEHRIADAIYRLGRTTRGAEPGPLRRRWQAIVAYWYR